MRDFVGREVEFFGDFRPTAFADEPDAGAIFRGGDEVAEDVSRNTLCGDADAGDGPLDFFAKQILRVEDDVMVGGKLRGEFGVGVVFGGRGEFPPEEPEVHF